MELNVKVAVRCRPMSSKEVSRGCVSIVQVSNGNAIHIDSPGDKAGGSKQDAKDFTFDFCYDDSSTQRQVYRDLGLPMVTKALDGFNGTIFAYGQTGSGKTHSMMGYTAEGDSKEPLEEKDDQRGIVPQLNEDLWARLNEKVKEAVAKADKTKEELIAANAAEGKPADANASTVTIKTMVTVSFLEVYNEEIKDLLNPKDIKLNIRESAEKGIFVEGLAELIVKDNNDLLRLIYQGNAVRRVAATQMNAQSSRSHSVFTIKIDYRTLEQLPGGLTKELTVKAKLNLVDLAGSERANKTGASGSTLKEGANINLSLMALGNVINALSEGSKKGAKKVIPYRDSKLTRLLQESLGGNSATLMIAAISPADYNFQETLGTLKYANRAKSIENAVSRNEDSNEKMIRELQEQIEALKMKLQNEGPGATQVDPGIEKKMREMELQQQREWEEREKLSKALEEERQANVNTVMSDMMNAVKEEKVTHMKNIKRLTNEKALLNKNFKETKEHNVGLKSNLDSNIRRYQQLQSSYDDSTVNNDGEYQADPNLSPEENAIRKDQQEKMADEMISLLTRIEEDRLKYTEKRDSLKRIKERLEKVDVEMTDERAELVTTAGLLNQNDKLREAIQQEEREKLQQAFDKELEAERAALSGNIRGEVESEMAVLRNELAVVQKLLQNEEKKSVELGERNTSLQQYAEELEGRLADSEVAQEFQQTEGERVSTELDELKTTVETITEELKKAKEDKTSLGKDFEDNESRLLAAIEAEKFKMFKTVMDTVMEERKAFEQKLQHQQGLLNQAAKDVMYLSQQNQELQTALNQAILYEPPIRG